MFDRKIFFLTAIVCALAFLACGFGGGDDDDDDDIEVFTISFPIYDGVRWTYDCLETGPDTSYVLTKVMEGSRTFSADTIGYVEPPAPHPSLQWARQLDRDSSFFYDDGNHVWMGQVDATIAGFGANPFVPLRVIPRRYAVGDTFTTLVNKRIGPLSADITMFITVLEHETVTVPAGTFEDCLKLSAVLAVSFGNDTTLSTFWCADGVGLVQRHDYYERGSDHTYLEKLVSYDID